MPEPHLAVLPDLVADDATVSWVERKAAELRAELAEGRVPIAAVVVAVNRDGSYSLCQYGTREAGTLSTIGALEAAKQVLLDSLHHHTDNK